MKINIKKLISLKKFLPVAVILIGLFFISTNQSNTTSFVDAENSKQGSENKQTVESQILDELIFGAFVAEIENFNFPSSEMVYENTPKIVDENSLVLNKKYKSKKKKAPVKKKGGSKKYNLPTPPTGNCSKNENYVVINVNTNIEQVYLGDPDCRTGDVIETRNVATGMKQYVNYLGRKYYAATPAGKWVIIKKEKRNPSSVYGPWFLRLHYINGGYVDQYALHGTNDPGKIGTFASHGCIRHYNSDIEHLNNILPVGTIVWTDN